MIEIKGIQYEEIPQPEPKRVNRHTMELMMIASMYYLPFMPRSNPQPRQKIKVDIVKEFELIQDKKSNLSRSQREWVVSQFNKKYRQVI